MHVSRQPVYVGRKKTTAKPAGTPDADTARSARTSSSSSASRASQEPEATQPLSRSGGASNTRPASGQTGHGVPTGLSYSSPDAVRGARNTIGSRPETFCAVQRPATPPTTPPRLSLSASRGARQDEAGRTPRDGDGVGEATQTATADVSSPQQRVETVLGGDPPLIQRIRDGSTVSFRVARATHLLPWASQIVELTRTWLGQGRANESLRLIDAVLAAIPVDDHPRLHRQLLALLARACRDTADAPDLRGCQGIGNAIRALAQRAWWDPTLKPSYFLPPQHRQALLARCDWAVADEVLSEDIERRLRQNAAPWSGHPAGTLDAFDLTLLMNDMDRLFCGAEEHQDRPRLQDLLRKKQHLVDQTVATEADDRPAISPVAATEALLHDRCASLGRRCERALRQSQTLRINHRLTLALSRDKPSGEWVLRAHAPTDDRPPRPPQDEQKAFIASVRELLEDPDGPPWPLLNDCVAKGCEATGWDAEHMPWLPWGLLEAGRRGPPAQRTQPLEQHLLSLTQGLESHAPTGGFTPFDRLFEALVDMAHQRPWRCVQQALDAIRATPGWRFTPAQQCALGLAFARRGEPQALAHWLQQDGIRDQMSQVQRAQLLEVCELPALSVAVRAQLLYLAAPLFPPDSPQQPAYGALRGKLDAQLPRRPIGSSRTPHPQQASPQRHAPMSPRRHEASPARRPSPPHVQIQEAREAMAAWFSVDPLRTRPPITRVSCLTAPPTRQDQQTFETALFHWMNLELRHQTLSAADLMDVIEDLEARWSWTIDRPRLSELFRAHARRSNDPDLLREPLPRRMAVSTA